MRNDKTAPLFEVERALPPTPQNFGHSRVTIHFDGGTPNNIPARSCATDSDCKWQPWCRINQTCKREQGYGEGYGSYRFDCGSVVRVRHGIKCSANTAEILTLCAALEDLKHQRSIDLSVARLEVLLGLADPRPVLQNLHAVHVEGDSQIALKWLRVAAGLPVRGKAKVSKGSSPEFAASIERLKQAVKLFSITCQWRGREHAVAAFGH